MVDVNIPADDTVLDIAPGDGTADVSFFQALAGAPGLTLEVDALEAEAAGAFAEDALSIEDAQDAALDARAEV